MPGILSYAAHAVPSLDLALLVKYQTRMGAADSPNEAVILPREYPSAAPAARPADRCREGSGPARCAPAGERIWLSG